MRTKLGKLYNGVYKDLSPDGTCVYAPESIIVAAFKNSDHTRAEAAVITYARWMVTYHFDVYAYRSAYLCAGCIGSKSWSFDLWDCVLFNRRTYGPDQCPVGKFCIQLMSLSDDRLPKHVMNIAYKHVVEEAEKQKLSIHEIPKP